MARVLKNDLIFHFESVTCVQGDPSGSSQPHADFKTSVGNQSQAKIQVGFQAKSFHIELGPCRCDTTEFGSGARFGVASTLITAGGREAEE